jgi:dihydroorotate dehydrogenase electron transfer subunit
MTNATGERGQLPCRYRVTAVRVENPTTRTLILDGGMEADPGQFVMAWLPGLDEKPFSLSGIDPVSITVARVGPFTSALHRLVAGDDLWLRGPYGQGFALCDGAMLLICGGCGAAPLFYLARVARQADCEVSVVLGVRTAAELFFVERYAALGCAVHVATDDGSAGTRGTALDLAEQVLAEGAYDTVYACGPEAMLAAVHLFSTQHRLPCQLSYEAYMRCGIGVCGSCAREGCLICRDGPVLRFAPT